MTATSRHTSLPDSPGTQAGTGPAPKTARRRATPWGGLHSSRIRYRFKVPVFDFFLQWALGAQTHGLSEVGESFYAAAQITDGDPDSWARAWSALAERVERRGRASLARGHRVSARESLLRAYAYHRAPLAMMSPLTDPDRFKAQWHKAHTCFRDAAALFEPPIEPINIPFQGRDLPGYIAAAANDGVARRTLLMIGGAETWCEDMYGYIGPAALKRGYNLVTVDLPLQGMTPFAGLTARADAETSLGAVLDHLETRPDINMNNVAVFGISAGGYLAPRAAMYDKRIGALIAFSMILDMRDLWAENFKATTLAKAERRGLLRMAERLGLKKIHTARVLFDLFKWRYGAATIEDLLDSAEQSKVDPALITCPTLILVAEQEYEEFPVSRAWQDHALATIRSEHKSMVVMPRDEGADSHAGGTNLSLVAQVVFDWLDDVFDHPSQVFAEPGRTTGQLG